MPQGFDCAKQLEDRQNVTMDKAVNKMSTTPAVAAETAILAALAAGQWQNCARAAT
jgi:hypothetical protein